MSLVTIPEVFAKVDFKGLVSFLFLKRLIAFYDKSLFIYLQHPTFPSHLYKLKLNVYGLQFNILQLKQENKVSANNY